MIRRQRILVTEFLASSNNSRPIMIFAPCLDWNVQLFQRPQQLALALARQGALVFYIQPKPNPRTPPFTEIEPNIYLCNVNARAFDQVMSPAVYLLTWNAEYGKVFNQPDLIYDYVDEIDVFYGDKQAFIRNHKILLQEATLVLTTADNLYREALAVRQDAILSPNAVDPNHFQTGSEVGMVTPPADLLPILGRKKPIIGYYGALARWFDYDLYYSVACLRPNYSFLLIGPDYDGTVARETIEKTDNIYWLGVKKYSELPAYLDSIDVATIPFVVNQITNSTSPLKLFEYMAGGKPVVVTPMRECMQYPGVLVGDSPERFAERLDEALKLAKDPAYQEILQKVVYENTWDTRARQILRALADRRQSTRLAEKS
ncbi:MAG: glycosyltransferase [Anaerolineaceae bacterium]|nr:glycosyltransferase [Anaerolineaceae bacterium]